MALVEINADLSRCALALERIAAAAERLVGPDLTQNRSLARPSGPDDLTVIDNATACRFEEEDLRKRLSGLPPADYDRLKAEWDKAREADRT